MMENSETPQREQKFTIKKTHNKKARPMIIDQMIEQARGFVIKADLELAFLKFLEQNHDAEKYAAVSLDPVEQKLIYDFYLARLNFFKEMRDNIRERYKDIDPEKEPKQITVELEK